MRDRDWVLTAICRSCGVGRAARVGKDGRIVWPIVFHEASCELADESDLTESPDRLDWTPA